jgi:hypothetical protein
VRDVERKVSPHATTSNVATRAEDDIEERSVILFLIWHRAAWAQSSAEGAHVTPLLRIIRATLHSQTGFCESQSEGTPRWERKDRDNNAASAAVV